MSADNGIYILKTKDSYRVRHAQAIENLFYSHLNTYGNYDEIIPTRAVQIFGDCKFTRDYDKALKIAHKMEDSMYTEYGVKVFSTHKSWRKIVNEAKELAQKEIDYLLKSDRGSSWTKYQVENLQRILNKYQ